MTRFTALVTMLFLGLASQAAPPRAADTLHVALYDYPPHVIASTNPPSGRFIDNLKELANEAGLKVEWFVTNMADESRMLDEARRPFCTTGRIYTPERATRWLYLPFEFDHAGADLVIVRRDAQKDFDSFLNVEQLAHDSNFTGVFVTDAFYGTSLDLMIEEGKPWLQDISKSELQSLALVANGRADYTILPKESWHAERYRNLNLKDLEPLKISQYHEDGRIFLACSKALPEHIQNRLRTAISATNQQANFPQ